MDTETLDPELAALLELSALPEMVPPERVARLLAVTPREAREIIREGQLPKAGEGDGGGLYRREDVVRLYYARGRATDEGGDLTPCGEGDRVVRPASQGRRRQHAAEIALGYMQYYAGQLAGAPRRGPHWKFLCGQMSAAATLANALRR